MFFYLMLAKIFKTCQTQTCYSQTFVNGQKKEEQTNEQDLI